MSNSFSFKSIFSVAVTGALVACGGGGSSSSSSEGSLSVAITDAPIDNALEVVVAFTGVAIKPQSGEEIMFGPFVPPKQINLLDLQGNGSTLLIDDALLPAGRYDHIRLDVNAFDISQCQGADPGSSPSYITFKDSGPDVKFPLCIPNSAQQGLRLVSPFTIAADGSTNFTIDFDLRKSITDPQGVPFQSAYFLRPALRIVDNNDVGSISGEVVVALLDNSNGLCSDNDPHTGNAVYVFGAGATPDDIDGVDGDDGPITTALVANGDNDGAYTYTVGFLPEGKYTVAFTCRADQEAVPETEGEGGDSEADDDLAFQGPMKNVKVTAGDTTTLDFAAQ